MSDRDTITLSTGRTFDANMGIVGISAGDMPYMDVSGGYDQHVNTDDWSEADHQALADHMIDLWTKYRTADRTDNSL